MRDTFKAKGDQVDAVADTLQASPTAYKLIKRLWAFIENGSDSDDFFEIRSEVRDYLVNVAGEN